MEEGGKEHDAEYFTRDARAKGSEDVEMEEENDSEDEDEMECIVCDENAPPPVRIAKCPGAPTQKEVDDHYVSHIPYRSWCQVCVKAKGKEQPHKKHTTKGGKPTISFDYKSFAENEDEDNIGHKWSLTAI